MRKLLILLCISFAAITAQTKYPAVSSLIEKGSFTRAEALIDSIIGNTKNLSASDLYELNFAKDKMNRIRLDFRKDEKDVMTYIKKFYPDADKALLEKFIAGRSLEAMEIDGKRMFFNRSHSNLFLINKEAKSQKEKVAGKSEDKLHTFLASHVPAVVDEASKTGEKIVKPVGINLNYTLTVEADAVPEGEVIRCWLPYPREGHKRQSDIKLNSVNVDNYVIADNAVAQRTLYMEKKAVKGQPTVFNMNLSYTCSSELYNIDPAKVKDYDRSSELYRSFTSERAPHVVFTPEIKELSKKIIGTETNPYKKALRIFEWISNNIPWAGAREYSTLDNIPAYCLLNRHGDCGIKSLLFITLARYNGIPAKWQSGWMLHPVEVNLHDWAEAYFEGYGWVPVDQSFGIQPSENPAVRNFYLGGMDSYRLIVNDDYSQPLYPAKIYPRSETVDFQRGEVEWRGGNIYFDKWDYNMDVKYSEPSEDKAKL